MNKAAINILSSLRNGNIFKTDYYSGGLDANIIREVPIFLKLLSDNFYYDEIFHGYLNKHYSVWNSILSDKFKLLIIKYNTEYDILRVKKAEMHKRMMATATEMDADNLMKEIEEMSLTPSISSLTRSFKKGSISKNRAYAKRDK